MPNIEIEGKAWAWLKKVEPKFDGFQKLFRLYDLYQTESHKTSVNEEKIESLTEDFLNLVETKAFILSTSTSGRFINGIEDEVVAISALGTLTGEIDKKLEGVLNALLFKKGLRKKLLPEKQAYLDLLADIRINSNKQLDTLIETEQLLSKRCRASEQLVIGLDDRVKKAIDDAESQKELFIKKVDNEIDGKLSKLKNNFDETINELKEQVEIEKNKGKENISNFIEAYKSEIQLKAPVSYWEENKGFHKKRAKIFGIASIVISPVIFAFITWVGWEVLSTEKVVWGKVGVIVFATSLAIWLIRILVRMYLSHTHLELSSQERVIMTKSYLALLSEGGASSPEERQLVLQSIFRPAATGLITDDAAPPNIIELINRIPVGRK